MNVSICPHLPLPLHSHVDGEDERFRASGGGRMVTSLS